MPLVNKAMNMDNGQVDTNGEGEKGKQTREERDKRKE